MPVRRPAILYWRKKNYLVEDEISFISGSSLNLCMINICWYFLVFSSLAQLQFSQNGSDDEKLRSIVSEKGQAEVVIPDPGNREIDRITRIVSISSVKDKEVRLFLSPLTVECSYQKASIIGLLKGLPVKALSVQRACLRQWMGKYPSYTQYDSIMRYFAATYPLLCILDTIGTSINGRLILCLKSQITVVWPSLNPKSFIHPPSW